MTKAKAAGAVTRKVGPLPVWGWAALALAAYFLIFRGPFGKPHDATGSPLPYTPARGDSAAQQPQSGQGDPADNTNADLLAALQENKSGYDALLAALQYGAYGGYGGYGGGYGAGSSGSVGGVPASTGGFTNAAATTDTASTSAPTIATDDNNAPAVQTMPAGSYVGDVSIANPDGMSVTYSGYTQDPAAVDMTGGYVNGIVPAIEYVNGNVVDPGFNMAGSRLPEASGLPGQITTPAYSPDPDNVQNALMVARQTGQAIAV